LGRQIFATNFRADRPSLEAGIESMLAFRLFAAEATLGALDLYGSRNGAFDETARAFGTVFAAHAALALAGAQIHEHDLTVASICVGCS